MPSKNVLKQYVEDGFYHIYTRGINKGNIFVDEQDYSVFMGYMKSYLVPKEMQLEEIKSKAVLSSSEIDSKLEQLAYLANYSDDISLLAFILMSNHIHFLLRQKNREAITRFLRSLLTRYSLYFNKRYNRTGSLYEGRYRAVLVDNENYLLYLSAYIHNNAKAILQKNLELKDYPWSSYPVYLGLKKLRWINTSFILSSFDQNIKGRNFGSYQGFVEGYRITETLTPYLLDR